MAEPFAWQNWTKSLKYQLLLMLLMHQFPKRVGPELYGNVAAKTPKQDCVDGECNLESMTPSCADRRRMLGLDSQDRFVLVEANLGQTIELECHYCFENEQDGGKLWFHSDRFFASSQPKEVLQNLLLPVEQRKLSIDEHHRLTVRNFSQNDGGIYFCQDTDRSSLAKFNFVVDVVSSKNEVNPKVGTYDEFMKYYQQSIQPISQKLLSEDSTGMTSWIQPQEIVELHFNISYDWASWGRCNICRRIKGVKRRYGKCRLVAPMSEEKNESKSRKSGALRNMKFGVAFSCHSLVLATFLDALLAARIKELADFIEEDECFDVCVLELGNDSEFGLNMTAILQLNAPEVTNITRYIGDDLRLSCPRAREIDGDSSTNDVIWLKNDVYLTSQSENLQPIENYLNFKCLNVKDSGNYSCSYGTVLREVFQLQVRGKQDSESTDRVKVAFVASLVRTILVVHGIILAIVWVYYIFVFLKHRRINTVEPSNESEGRGMQVVKIPHLLNNDREMDESEIEHLLE